MAQNPVFEEALTQAYLYNPRLVAERKHLRETDEGLPRALSGWRPRVTIGASPGVSAVFDSMDTQHQPERRVPQQFDLTLTQPLYTGGRVHAQVGQAEAMVEAGRAVLQATESSVLLSAATTFLDVARDEALLALNNNQAAVLERTLTASVQQVQAGALTDTDVAQARARLANQRAVVAQASTALAKSRARYEQEIGAPAGDFTLPRLDFRTPPALAGALALLSRNFDVLQSRAMQEASLQGIDLARSGLMPQLSIQVRGTRSTETDVQLAHQRDNIAEATVQLSIPLYQGGEVAAEIRQAKEAAAFSLSQTDNVIRSVREQIESAWAGLEGARSRAEAYRISTDSNIIAERGISRQQRVGQRTLLDVLNAEQERFTADVNLVSARHDLYVAKLQLQAATGQLSAANLGLNVLLYDATQHYDETRNRWYGTTQAP